MVSSFGSAIKSYAVSRCTTDTNFSFDFFPDDTSYLNHQEKLFVDDPANAHLFDECPPLKPQSKRKRSIEDTPSLPKTKRTEEGEKDEVSKIVYSSAIVSFRLRLFIANVLANFICGNLKFEKSTVVDNSG